MYLKAMKALRVIFDPKEIEEQKLIDQNFVVLQYGIREK
jgi:hypothetical protein